jgi:hypothetical protein
MYQVLRNMSIQGAEIFLNLPLSLRDPKISLRRPLSAAKEA